MRESTIASLVNLKFWQHHQDGSLTVIPDEGASSLHIPIRRVFTLTNVPIGGARGDHAHRFCTQVVVCLHGRVSVAIDDGKEQVAVVLDDPSQGLSIPPGLWNRITFEKEHSVLAVFCDQPYDPADYLRNWNEFLIYKGC